MRCAKKAAGILKPGECKACSSKKNDATNLDNLVQGITPEIIDERSLKRVINLREPAQAKNNLEQAALDLQKALE